jgi:hypothetical protein
MQITASAISLNVDDVTASATFVKQHLASAKRCQLMASYRSPGRTLAST